MFNYAPTLYTFEIWSIYFKSQDFSPYILFDIIITINNIVKKIAKLDYGDIFKIKNSIEFFLRGYQLGFNYMYFII